MDEKYAIKLFKEYKIRTKWNPEIEDYYYSIIDVIAVLTEIELPRLVESWIPGTFKPGQPRCPNG